MQLHHKVRAVEKVFSSLQKEIESFQGESGLSCVANCGFCCTKADIEASALEFLPLAYALYKKGEAMAWYERMKADIDNPTCSIFRSLKNAEDKGFCSSYAYRGLICRLFAFSAIRDKYGEKNFIVCKPLKTEKAELIADIKQGIAGGMKIPMMSDYYYQLYAIDEAMGRERMPINRAIVRALEEVMFYYAYRKPPKMAS